MQHPTLARRPVPDLGMARLVSDVALVDTRVMDPLAPIGPRPLAAPAVPAVRRSGAGGCRSGVC